MTNDALVILNWLCIAIIAAGTSYWVYMLGNSFFFHLYAGLLLVMSALSLGVVAGRVKKALG